MASILRAVSSHSSEAVHPSASTTPPTAAADAFNQHASSLFDALKAHPTVATVVTIVLSLLILEQAVYRSKKGRLPGDRWTIPIIGKFADSLSPTLEGYQRQWDSGELSAISVFNMCVVSLAEVVCEFTLMLIFFLLFVFRALLLVLANK